MIISQVMCKLSLFKQSSFIACRYFISLEKTVVYIVNRTIHVCLEIPDLFLVSNLINVISCSTLEINLIFPRIHVYYSLFDTKIT